MKKLLLAATAVFALMRSRCDRRAEQEDARLRGQRRVRLLEGGRGRGQEGPGRAAELQPPPSSIPSSRRRRSRPASWTIWSRQASCGRVDPARLARGLARACERLGVTIYERTAAQTIEPGRVVCAGGVVRAGSVLRATEAFTVQQPGERRRFMPLYSLMVATEPLPAEVWERIGWDGHETVSDLRHLFFYAQRTPDDRIAIGGRGAPYRLGSPLDEAYERNDAVRARLVRTLAERFPAVASRGDHAPLGRAAGGAARLVLLGALRPRHRLRLGRRLHRARRGHEPCARPHARGSRAEARQRPRLAAVGRPREPALGAGAAALHRLARDRDTLGSADRYEDRSDRPARRTRLVQPFMQVR